MIDTIQEFMDHLVVSMVSQIGCICGYAADGFLDAYDLERLLLVFGEARDAADNKVGGVMPTTAFC